MRFNDLVLEGQLWTYLADLNEQATDGLNSSHEQYPQSGRGNCVGTNRIYDNILPDFIFDGVRLPVSRSSISCVSKKDRNRALNVLMFLPLV